MDPALYANILANPNDDMARLVMADWLEEHGDIERAEFIRLQIKMDQLGITRPIVNPMGEILQDGTIVQKLVDREQELLVSMQPGSATGGVYVEGIRTNGRYAWAGAAAALNDPDKKGWSFKRGFVEQITCTAEEFLKYADDLLWQPSENRPCPLTACPINEVTLTTELDWGGTDGYHHIRVLTTNETIDPIIKRTCKNEISWLDVINQNKSKIVMALLKLEWPQVKKWNLYNPLLHLEDPYETELYTDP